jgi:hypothetical protein
LHKFTNQKRLPGLSCFNRGRLACAAAAALAIVGFAAPTRALTITPIYNAIGPNGTAGATKLSDDPNAAVYEGLIQTEINKFESYISNPVTISITFQELPNSGGLADSNGSFSNVNYSDYLTGLSAHQTLSSVDTSAIASLSVAPHSALPNNPVNGNAQILIKDSLASQVVPGGSYDQSSNIVEFNPFNTFTSRLAPVTGKYDLTSALDHELDEILGVGGAGSNLNNVLTNFHGATAFGTDSDSAPGVMDLFRYSASGVRSYDTSTTAVSYFSVDGGATDLVHFNQQGAGGSDLGDWGNGNTTGDQVGNTPDQTQDAFSSPAFDPANPIVYPDLGPSELTALDAVGWNLTATGAAIEAGSPVPEPTSLSLLAIGTISLFARRRRLPQPDPDSKP